MRPAIPVRLSIPSLGINAPVEEVGRTPDGAMQEPPSPTSVAWYAPGARPGEAGNAVIAGHVDSATGAAVFWRIRELQRDDLVVVTDAAGRARPFVVDRVEQVPADAAPMEQIFGSASSEHLNLITCSGAWDYARRRYRDRLIVFTRALHLPPGLQIFPSESYGAQQEAPLPPPYRTTAEAVPS